MIVHSLILQYLKYSVSRGGRGCDTIMRLVISKMIAALENSE